MTNGRRHSDRRRRVLYTTHQAESTPSTAASRRAAERLREARRPTAAYGVRVKRRLHGRWFSLVPVRRRTLITIVCVLFGLSGLLCLGHYAAVAWPSIAYRPEIARPLRLDRPDSFGRWMICALLAGASGISLMIYQLRRYRIDDYQGRYRLWRLVLVVLMLASLNALVSIIDWGGAVLEAGLGKRAALSGSDWIRLVVTIGGAILGLRLVAEMRRSRLALGTLLAACAILAIPEAAKWNVLKVESLGLWTLVTSAPLLAFTTLFVSLGSYLRMLYREVRQIDDGDSLAERMQRLKLRVFSRQEEEEDEPEEEQDDRPKRRWWNRRDRERDAELEEEEEEYEEEEVEEEPESSTTDDDQPARPRRRWFGLRRAKSDESEQAEEEVEEDSQQAVEEEQPEKPKRKKRRFSLRLDPAAAAKPEPDEAESEEEDESPSEPKRRRGLGGWLRNKKKPSDEEPAQDDPQPAKPQQQPSQPSPAADSEEEINPDEIDWSSLSKSERRRLRKKLKRQGRAA